MSTGGAVGSRAGLRTLGEAVGDPIEEGLRRLRILCGIVSFVPAVLSVFLFLAPHGTAQHDARLATLTVYAVAITLSLITLTMARSPAIHRRLRLDLALAYEVLMALDIAYFRHHQPWAAGDGFREVSPVALWIVLFAAIVPSQPRRALTASLLSATADVVGLALSVQQGNPLPSAAQILGICASSFLAAASAWVIASVLYGLMSTVDQVRRLGSYELVHLLGRGGMGDVWLARHRLLARPAAVKLIRAESLGGRASQPSGSALHRFEREAQATAGLRSPHTVELYDFGVSDGTFYYVMEYLDGIDLDAFVEEHGPMPAARVIHVLRQACASLDEAHHQGLIHRDVKPANIYLCRLGREVDFVKVLDFGLVKRTGDHSPDTPDLTATGALAGTPAFLAPELALGDRPVDGRADLYSLACVGYWLLTGKPVFEADSAMKAVIEHVRSTPVPPSRRSHNVIPPELEAILLECLEKDPDARPRDAAELSRRLANVDVSEPWTPEAARSWWNEHRPEKQSLAEVNSSGATTMRERQQ
jgi:eukaryotic-like serine/threonine-protein kinase